MCRTARRTFSNVERILQRIAGGRQLMEFFYSRDFFVNHAPVLDKNTLHSPFANLLFGRGFTVAVSPLSR